MNSVAASQPAIRFDDFSLAFATRHSVHTILEGCNLDVPKGGFYLLRGPSGSGKSTILRWLTGLWDEREQKPKVSGCCEVLGDVIEFAYPTNLRRRVAAVLQDVGLLDDLSPRQNVELALNAAGRSPKLALGLLSQAGLEHPPELVSALSGGMRKRAGVARGLAAQPELFIFDEPSAGLDSAAARQLAELLFETHNTRNHTQTTIVITHDLEAFREIASGVIEIDAANKTLVLRNPGDPPLPAPTVGRPPTEAQPPDPILAGCRQVFSGLGSLTYTFATSIVHLPPVFVRLCGQSVLRHVLESAFFIGLGSAMLGFLATYFALRNSPLEGAFQDQILVGVGKVNVSVLTPLIAGFFFTARMAAGAAARMGTMKRSNQIAALTLMGISPADYLLTPLVFGFCFAMPLVTLGGAVLSSLASAGSASLVVGFSSERWSEAFFSTIGLEDIRFILAKTVLSGFLVAVWTYHLAMGPKHSGRAVGDSVNLAIVVGMLTVLAVHGLLTVWQFT